LNIARKIRLLYYAPTVGGSGNAGSQRTIEFASSLTRNGFSVFLASPCLKDFVSIGDLRLIPTPKNPLLIVKKLKEIACINQIDIILERLDACNVITSGYGSVIGKLLRIPFACEIHVPPYNFHTFVKTFIWFNYSVRNADKLFVVSENAAKLLKYHGIESNDSRLVIFPNGFDSSKLDNSLKNKNEKLFATDKIIISYFGELSEDKGAHLILKLINRTNETCDKYFYIIGGWGPLEESFKLLSAEKPKSMVYLGKISKEKIFACLRASDLSLALYKRTQFGGLFFGQPLKVYESLICGTNVMVTSQMNLPIEIFNLCTTVSTEIENIAMNLEQAAEKKHNIVWQRRLKKIIPNYSWDNIINNVFYPELFAMVQSKNCRARK
jgi:glycosyltransferase involved in cell wall biosynthesis